jgi:transposase
MAIYRLGIDVACRSEHQATLTDRSGEILWTGFRFRTTITDLRSLWAKIPPRADLTVIMEPTRNAWAPLAAWLEHRGAHIVLASPEQSADLRKYYNKHAKTDRLDSQVLARMPLLHPGGLGDFDGPGPQDALRRAVRRRSKLMKTRTTSHQRLGCLLELLGPTWHDALGHGDYSHAALAVLEHYSDPRALRRFGMKRLTALLRKHSRGQWREAKARELLDAATETLALWSGSIDFDELSADIACEVRIARAVEAEIVHLDKRIATLLEAVERKIDDEGIVSSVPGIGPVLAAGIVGRFGDLDRFENLAGVRSFTGLVPKLNQSGENHGYGGLTKSGDPGLREALYLAADQMRRVDPTIAKKYRRLVLEEGKHHDSALCSLGAVVATRIAACWRSNTHYVLRDVDGTRITEEQGRKIVQERYKLTEAERDKRRTLRRAKQLKNGTGGQREESTKAAPRSHPSRKKSSGTAA